MQELLNGRPILRSRHIDEARAFLSTRSVRLDVPGSAGERLGFEVRYNGVYLSRLWLGFIRYGASTINHVYAPRGDYWLHFPLQGRMSMTAESATTDFGSGLAALTSPTDVCVLRMDAQVARLCVAIKGDALMRHLEAMLDDVPGAPLRLAPSLDLTDGFGRYFASMLHNAAMDFGTAGALPGPMAASDFEQLVLTSLLLSQPHNYSAALRRREGRVAPRDVRRAEEYIQANAGEAITLGDLARASGVAGRTLLKHFRVVHGVSPMRYLRNHRLCRVRAELRAGNAENVSTIAARWGFAHLGRFAIDYRTRFGESPSATLARNGRT